MSKWELTENEVIVYTNDKGEKCYDSLDIIVNKLNKYEKQLAELKAENERLLNENGYLIFADGYDENDNPVHKQIYKTYKESNKELVAENKKIQQQLKEKDEEIEKLKSGEYVSANIAKKSFEMRDELLKTNAKQVCEKIRNEFTEEYLPFYLDDTAIFRRDDLFKVLDQIERGES